MRHNGHREPEQIQADIERTRSELDHTLSAIEQRLTPGQLVDQGLDYLRRHGAKEYVANLGEAVKRDPLPLAFVGIGLAWLMASDRGRSGEPRPTHDTTAALKERTVALDVCLLKVGQQPLAAADQQQQPTAAVVVVLVHLQVLGQILDLVAGALLAEFAEVGQVLADLGRTDPQTLGQFVR